MYPKETWTSVKLFFEISFGNKYVENPEKQIKDVDLRAIQLFDEKGGGIGDRWRAYARCGTPRPPVQSSGGGVFLGYTYAW